MPLKVLSPTLVPFAKINPSPYNPKKIQRSVIEGLKTSMDERGFIHPLVVQKKGFTLVGGHARLIAVRELCIRDGIDPPDLPAYVLDLSDRDAKLLNIRLNKMVADFDEKMLANLLAEMDSEIKLSHDEIIGIGSTDTEILNLLAKVKPKEEKPEEPTKSFGKSVTLSLKFTDVEVRDRVKRHLDSRSEREKKTSGEIIAALLGLEKLCGKSLFCFDF
ncbi:MAG: hypothetical protein E6R03_10790 [Hyphomicrobiaceae bacterium]|nr:MAG: hypothetical protein E6R03_10790 [Hyphomicrobiaceae bacterium]